MTARMIRLALAALVALVLAAGPSTVVAHEGHEHEEEGGVPAEIVVGGLVVGAFVVGAGGTWWLRRRDADGEPEQPE